MSFIKKIKNKKVESMRDSHGALYKSEETVNKAGAVYSSVRGSQNTERHLANKGGNKQLAQPPPLNPSARYRKLPEVPLNKTLLYLNLAILIYTRYKRGISTLAVHYFLG